MGHLILDQFTNLRGFMISLQRGQKKGFYKISFISVTGSSLSFILPNFINLGSEGTQILSKEAHMPWDLCLLFVATSICFFFLILVALVNQN
jgi:hypothetical protein